MGAISTTAGAHLRRRRTQAIVLAAILFLASAAATLALNVLWSSNDPFAQAFARANGAHLVIDYRGAVGEEAVAATTTADVVTDRAGPWPVGSAAIGGAGGRFAPARVSGRGVPGTRVDAITVSEGRWWQTAGEVVIGQDIAALLGLRVGDLVEVAPSSLEPPTVDGGSLSIGPGGSKPPPPEPIARLTVTGIAQSVSTPDVGAWLSPVHVSELTADARPDLEMLYRVEPANTDSQLAAAYQAITRDLPIDAVADHSTYLEHRAEVDETAQLYTPILLAFAVFALFGAAFLIANAVSGIVLSHYRAIGVQKALGFTPAQIGALHLAEILMPVVAGAAAGAAVGSVASLSAVETLTRSFGLPGAFVVWLPLAGLVVALGSGIAVLAAIGPIVGAARIRPAQAISVGAAPADPSARGLLRRFGRRLPAPLPMRLGIEGSLDHPWRTAMTLGALVVAVAAVTFALTLNLSLLRVIRQLDRDDASPVRAQLGMADGRKGGAPAISPSEVSAQIAANPATERWVGSGQATVGTRQLGAVSFIGYDGDASWIGFSLIRGRWIERADEVVAPTNFFRRSGLAIGDSLDISGPGGTASVALVGETFETDSEDGILLRGAWDTLTRVVPAASIDSWEIRPSLSATPQAYADWLKQVTEGAVGAHTLADSTADEEFLLFLSVVALVGIVISAVALGGVFNTVLLETRQRTRELAVLKALGLSPRQVITMVEAAVVPVGLLAGLLGVPVGLLLQRAALSYMGETAAQTGIPESSFDVVGPVLLVVLALTGLVMAALGAFVPAQRAARARIAPVLLAE
jgi:putative ABC transport system permease protein